MIIAERLITFASKEAASSSKFAQKGVITMKMLKNGFARCARLFAGDRKGVTALEYGLIAALIAGVIITAVSHLGSSVNNTFTTLNDKIGSAGQ